MARPNQRRRAGVILTPVSALAELDAWKEMGKQLESIKENLKLLFYYLDYTEESDSGREFHPISFTSCRVLMTQPFGKVLINLKESINEQANGSS